METREQNSSDIKSSHVCIALAWLVAILCMKHSANGYETPKCKDICKEKKHIIEPKVSPTYPIKPLIPTLIPTLNHTLTQTLTLTLTPTPTPTPTPTLTLAPTP